MPNSKAQGNVSEPINPKVMEGKNIRNFNTLLIIFGKIN
jgi:hypothetical protein